jgi:hypothetical protein
LEASREFEKTFLVRWRMVAEIAAKAHDPALAFLCHNDAAPPVRAASPDYGAKLAVQLLRLVTV